MEGLVGTWVLFLQLADSARTYNNQQKATNPPGRSAKPLCVGSIPTRASKFLNNLATSRKDLVAKMVINWTNFPPTNLLQTSYTSTGLTANSAGIAYPS
jgi:hypothetical protein